MKYDVLHNFISPVTGRILVDTDYVIVGDDNGVGVPSPILIDLELDLINLRANYNILRQASFVIGYPNDQLPQAQVLNSLEDGYMYNTDGVVSTNALIPITDLPNLTENYLWRGDSDNRPVEVATIEVNNLPNLTYNRVWVGNIINRPTETNFSVAPDNATYVIRTPSLSLPNAQVLNLLGTGMAKITFGGYIAIARSGVDYVTPLELEHEIGVLEAELVAFKNKVRLEFLGVEAEFAVVEAEIGVLEAEIIALGVALEAEIIALGAALEAEIIALGAALEAEIIALGVALGAAILGVEIEVFILGGTVAGLGITVTYLESEVITLQNQINNLRLNNIPADGNVSLYNYRIIDLADPVDPQDGATRHFVETYVDSAVTGATSSLTIDGFVVGGPPVDNVITTTRGPTCLLTNIPAGGDVSMDNYRITNLKQSPEGDFDAVSFKFLWDLMHDEVEILWP
jgi:hypothetical protein